jgi:hypothetical protein
VRLALSEGSNKVGLLLLLSTEDENRPNFQNVASSSYLRFQMMEKSTN